jgi:drug/metabolite transporter (DMT)-like permease
MRVDLDRCQNSIMKWKSDFRKWLLMAHDQADSDEVQLTHEFPGRMLGSRRSTATLATGVWKNQSQPLRLKTRTVIALLVASNVLGNFSLSRGLHEVGRLISFSPWPYIHAFVNPLVVLGVLLLIVWLISQLSLLSRVDLSYVLPVTSVSYVLTALMGEFLLHERVSTERWIGIGLIGLGVSLVVRTVPRTAPVLHKFGDLPCEAAQ